MIYSEKNIKNLIQQGEGASIEFKDTRVRPESLAKEMVAFSNTSGGIIFMGISDEGKIEGLDDSRNWEEWFSNISRTSINPYISPQYFFIHIDSKKIGIIKIPKGLDKPYQTIDGKYWIRVGSTNRQATKEELSRLFQLAGLIHYDESCVEKAHVPDLNMDSISHYFKNNYDISFEHISQEEKEQILINSNICETIDHTIHPTLAGLLVFGHEPQKKLMHSSLLLTLIKGEDITDTLIEKKEITGNLPTIIEKTLSLLQLFLPHHLTLENMIRKEELSIPKEVLREVLVNMLCHRDYSISNRKSFIHIYSDRVEFTNPGRIPNSLTLEKLKYGNSAPRNFLIVKFMENMGYIDGLGRGIPRIYRLMKDKVTIEEEGDTFKVVLNYTPRQL